VKCIKHVVHNAIVKFHKKVTYSDKKTLVDKKRPQQEMTTP